MPIDPIPTQPNFQGTLHTWGTNQTLWLHQPPMMYQVPMMWVVRSGQMAIFAVELEHDRPDGRRHHLFSIYPGMVLFSLEQPLEQPQSTPHHQLLAVPLEKTELLQVPPEAWDATWRTQPQVILDAVQSWMEILTQVTQPLQVPLYSQSLPDVSASGSPQHHTLAPNETVRASKFRLLGLRVQQGQLQWMGLPQSPVSPNEELVLINSQIWLVANSETTLQLHGQLSVLPPEALWTGLRNFHHHTLASLDVRLAQQQHQTQTQFQKLQFLNAQTWDRAMGQLATILQPKSQRRIVQGTPLLMAMGAIGHHLGVTIAPPPASENLARLQNPLDAITRASRLRYRKVLLRHLWWQRDGGPLLGYRLNPDPNPDPHRPVALLPCPKGGYECFDPQDQTRIPLNQTLDHNLAPEAYTFYRPLPSQSLKAWDLITFALAGRLEDFGRIIWTGLGGVLLGMVTPLMVGVLMDVAVPNHDRTLLWQLGLGLLAAAFGTATFQLAQGLSSLRLETTSDSDTQAAIWDRLLNLRVSFFRQYSAGDLLARVSAITSIRQQLSTTTLRTLFSSFFSLFYLALLLYYSPALAIVATGVALLSFSVTTVAGILILKQQYPRLELQGKIFGLMVQLINGISKLRVAGGEERAFAHWVKQYSQQIHLELSTQLIEDGLVLFNTLMPTLTLTTLFWSVVRLSQDMTLSTGEFLAFNVAFGIFIRSTASFSNTIVSSLAIIPLWQRVQPILAAEPEIDQQKSDPGQLLGQVELNHGTFRYGSHGPLTLDNVTITANPGEFIALVGPSGSGKSTVLRLLLGFDTPELGAIYYDGQDLAGLDIYAVRRQIGVVLQNSRINAASIFDNIAGDAKVTMEEAWQAVQMSGLGPEIEALPMGMHTLVSEGGTNLSGGQRQRLIVARALVLQPKLLFLDEATSALDNRTQEIVSQSLAQLHVTRIVIAHRLSTIRKADRIYVLAGGRVVETGTFETLAHQGGLFSQLMARQLS